MISKDLLLATGAGKLTIININSYSIIRIIDVYGPKTQFDPTSNDINAACLLTENIILTVDDKNNIIQWKIENDNLKFISIKENAHDSWIYTLSKLGNGLILSGSRDKSIKIW